MNPPGISDDSSTHPGLTSQQLARLGVGVAGLGGGRFPKVMALQDNKKNKQLQG